MGKLHPVLAGAAAALALQAAHGAVVVAAYDFDNTLDPVAGVGQIGAGALVEVDPLNLSGFTSATVNGVNRTVWRFNGAAAPATNQGGLQFVNANLMNPNAYTIELYFSFDAVSSWRRIIDTKDRTSDQGFYVLSGGLQLYPSNVGTGTFNANTYYHVMLSYSGTQAVAYLNGVAQSTENTTYYSLPASNVISLFLDNTQSNAQNEYSAGYLAWARFYDGVTSATEATAAYNSAIAFDPGPPTPGGGGGGTPVPEPASAGVVAIALGTIAQLRRRRQRQA